MFDSCYVVRAVFLWRFFSFQSPVSMKVTLRQLLTGINLNLADCLEMEYRISQHCVEAQKDFYEGVRAGK